MLRYTFDNSVQTRHILSTEVARMGATIETRDFTPTLVVGDYEVASVLRQGSNILISADQLVGPGTAVLDLIRNIEERLLLGDDPLGDHHGQNT